MRPTDLPALDRLLSEKPCGTRVKYIAGCRCKACKRANTTYESERARARKAGDMNGVVDAAPAREHIKKLGRAGVGYRMVAEAASVPTSIVVGIKSGARPRARARTVRKILRVTIDSRGDKALVSGASTWRRIEKLLEEGFTKRQLARLLGYKSPAIQFRRQRVTVRTRARVERLFEKLTT